MPTGSYDPGLQISAARIATLAGMLAMNDASRFDFRTPSLPGEPGVDPRVRSLLNDVDEFVSYLDIVRTPEVDAIRDRLQRSLSDAKLLLLRKVAGAPAIETAAAPRALRRMQPWIAIGAGALLGTALCMMWNVTRHKGR